MTFSSKTTPKNPPKKCYLDYPKTTEEAKQLFGHDAGGLYQEKDGQEP